MKHQQVHVDVWATMKSMFLYIALTILGWIMFRMFNTVFTLPRRMRLQQDNIQATLEEFQRRFPGLNVTEEELREAEQEMDKWTKEYEQQKEEDEKIEKSESVQPIEDKKSI